MIKSLKMPICSDYCYIDYESIELVKKIYGNYYSRISGIDSQKLVEDVLSPVKSINQAEILSKFIDLNNKKVLEIGSGFGVNHIVWTKKFKIDGWGAEPNSEGFESSFEISKNLLKKNGLRSERIVDAVGEDLPFADNEFDLVYSSNVLEHTQDPAKVIDEAVRVLKPGGIMQMIFPNYYSFYEGHYAVFMPPVFSSKLLLFYIRYICRRDVSYVKTLRTELNVNWTKKTLRTIKEKYDFDVVSLGEDVFLERMEKVNFAGWAGLYKIKRVVQLLKVLNLTRAISRMLLFFNCYTPVILTLRKNR